MNVVEIEAASRQAWPALEEQDAGFGVLLASGGASKRVNSLNLYADSEFDPQLAREASEDFFGQRGQASIVCVLDSPGRQAGFVDLDRHLALAGYRKKAHTQVMALDLAHRGESVPEAIRHTRMSDLESWLAHARLLTGQPATQTEIQRRALKGLCWPSAPVLAACRERVVRSCGLAVKSDDCVGLFSIATAATHRGRGYASSVISVLLDWGRGHGARVAYLQVETANTPALSLYRKLGFASLYSYWYRVRGTDRQPSVVSQ